jgi:hypothetical protein
LIVTGQGVENVSGKCLMMFEKDMEKDESEATYGCRFGVIRPTKGARGLNQGMMYHAPTGNAPCW